ncbi:MAG TPA: restriction endonuclease subunit S [Panacibacter sp.]|nr:restriction endonuclease subunit S [Panacibacter sp.]
MNNWKKYKLGEVVSLQRGHDLTVANIKQGKYPVAGSNGPIGFHNEFTTKGPSLTIGRSGNSIGVAHYYENDFWAHNTTLYAKEFNHSHPKFIFYLLKTIDFLSHNSGSAVPSLNRNYINPFEVLIPDLPTQTRIASILSSLDDKIELNRRMNQTLEQMAQTLFKKYFVDDIDKDNLPEGWNYKKVKDLYNITIGRTPPREQKEWFTKNNDDVKWISIKDMGISGVYISQTSEYLTGEAVKRFNIPIIPKDTVILSFKLTVGRVSISTEEMLSNEAIAHFIPKPATYLTTFFVYLFLINFDYDSLGNTSSIATAVNSQTIKEIDILLPEKNIVLKFSKTVSAIFKKIKINQEEIKALSKIRDTLLPKLMSGEIEVGCALLNVDQNVKECDAREAS